MNSVLEESLFSQIQKLNLIFHLRVYDVIKTPVLRKCQARLVQKPHEDNLKSAWLKNLKRNFLDKQSKKKERT